MNQENELDDTLTSNAETLPSPKNNVCDICNKGAGNNGRNLVVCIDGTANQYSDKSTNVVSLYSRIVKGRKQRTIYISGIGTYARPSYRSAKYARQLFASYADSGIAINFETNIFHAYAWLADNYEEEDKIFLFGFSRGAYQVRALAAMINLIGLLHKGNDAQIPFAYELFAESDGTRGQLSTKMAGKKRLFKRTFCRDVPVHFVGAWDTVSSIGFQRKPPTVTDGSYSACYFRHALALDERRVKFLPEYFKGGIGDEPDISATAANRNPFRWLTRLLRSDAAGVTDTSSRESPTADPAPSTAAEPRVKEVWFAGCHSDIGGGAMQNDELSLWGPALRWMSFEAIKAGLDVMPPPRGWKPSQLSDSFSPLWKMLEILHFKRLTYSDGNSTSRLPHLGKRRIVRPCHFVHETARDLAGPTKIPDACCIEEDPFAAAKRFLEKLKDCCSRSTLLCEEGIAELQKLLGSGTVGRHSLCGLGDELFPHLHTMLVICAQRLRNPDIPTYATAEHITAALLVAQDELVRFTLPNPEESYNPTCVSDVLDISPYPSDWTFPLPFIGHTASVSSVAFLGTERIVSGSMDGSVRIWNVRTGHELLIVNDQPGNRERKGINCVAVSEDAKWIVYCTDHSADLWSVDTQRAETVLVDVVGKVLCVAVSSDGQSVVCGMFDASVRVLHREMQYVQFGINHTNSVRSVAFSSDGQHFVTGSDDCSLQLWDAKECVPWGDSMLGHSDYVRAVAFSRDGLLIISGSDDCTIRIWCTRSQSTLCTIEESNFVRSVAFSARGDYVLSASTNEKIRLRKLELGEQPSAQLGVEHDVGVPVLSAGFSSCCSHIVTGLEDGTIRVWDRIIV